MKSNDPTSVKLLFHKINGAREKLDVLAFTFGLFDIVCIVEHLLNSDNAMRLELSDDHDFFIRPAKTSLGRPSGGLVVAIHKKFQSKLVDANDLFIAVDLGGVTVLCRYLSTNHRNATSNHKFTISYAR